MATFPVRVLVSEDYEPFRRALLSILRKVAPDIYEVSDGMEAVREAQRLQPDVILLDIGLPTLNGIEAARQIRKLSPASKIIFVTQESSVDVVREARSVGASGYVVKTDVGNELLAAITAVLQGEQFLGSRFAGHDFTGVSNLRITDTIFQKAARISSQKAEAVCHAAQFYSDDDSLLDGFTKFIGTGLKAGSAVIVIATESHREALLQRLQVHGIDMVAAMERHRYTAYGSEDILSKFMVNDVPDPIRLFKQVADLIDAASNRTRGAHTRVVACGELAPLLLMQGKPESAIRLEQLWDHLATRHGLDTLCGYSLSSFHSEQGRNVFQRISALHSVVHPG